MKTTASWALLAAALLLGGCAAMRSVSSDVSSYGEWPAERKAGSYAFERLPSQQARPAESDALEAAARAALESAGFKPVEANQAPDVLVQVGARETRTDLSPWDDPLWWQGGFGYWRHGPWLSPRWSMSMSMRHDFPRYERQVALLLRDRASGKPLFEAHASSEGSSRLEGGMLGAMFQAAMMDFPRLGMNPRRVVVEMPK
ncbi:MAG: DUF4136 domain-containing protein [Rubrivivax sp.]|nr:DUF4136 domain-containing protein [Rubrivivax sp.]